MPFTIANLDGTQNGVVQYDSGGNEKGVPANPVRVDPTGTTTQPVSATTLPLPTGAATSALQTSGNASLSSMDAKTPALGQALMAVSTPVVIASDQSAVPVSAASLPLPAGAATEATLSAINTKIPASPAQEHVAAASPHAVRLTDGAAFYKATTPSDTQPVSGTVTANAGTGTFTVAGNKTNNGVAPGATNVGTLPAVATAAAPTYTEGNQAALSTDLTGAVRITGSISASNPSVSATGAAVPGSATYGGMDVGGNLTGLTGTANGLKVDGSAVVQPVSDNSGSLTVDTPQLPAALVGGRLDVVVGASLPAGANNIGDVDVLTVPAPLSTTGGGTEAAALRVTLANDSTGVLSVDDNGSSLTVDGTVTGNQGTAAAGSSAWPVAITNTADTVVKPGDAVNNAVRVNIVAGAGSGGAAQADKSSFVEGTTQFTPVGGVFNETITADPTEDQAAAARITAKRAVHTNLRSSAGTELATAGAPLRTDPTGSTAQPVTDNGGALTVDTAQLPAALVGGRLDVVVGAALPAGANNIGDVDVASVPAPLSTTGGGTEAAALRVTLANDSTGLLSVDDNAGSLTVDTPQLPAALVGGRLDANVGTWLGSTAPSVGQKTMANSLPVALASDQGAVGVSGTVTANQGTAAAGSSAWPIAVTNTADTVVKPGDAVNNAVRVNIVAGAGSGGVAQADKSSFVEGTTQFTPVGGVFNETITADPTEDQAAAARITAKRAVHVNLRSTAGTELGTAGAPVRTDPTGSTAQPVTDNGGSLTVDTAQLPAALVGGRLDVVVGAALPAGANNIGDVDVASVPAPLSTTGGGTEAAALRVTVASDSTGLLSVDDNAGSLTVDTPQLPAALVGGRLDVVVGAALPAGTNNIGDVDVLSVPAPLSTTGGGTEAAALRVTVATDSTGVLSVDDNAGSLTVDTPQLPAALVGGRLDGNVGAWLGSTAPTVGQKTAANSVPVVVASDQTTLPVKEVRSSTSSVTSVAQNAASVTLLALNANRLGATIVNDAVSILYAKLGATASTASYTVRMRPYDYFEVPFGYTGIIDGIWAAAGGGNARLTELT